MSTHKNSNAVRLVLVLTIAYFLSLTIWVKDPWVPMPMHSQSGKLFSLMILKCTLKLLNLPAQAKKNACLSTTSRNIVLAAMQAASASANLPIFGLQGSGDALASVGTAVKNLSIQVAKQSAVPPDDPKGGKQLAAHPVHMKIKTEKALYTESTMPAVVVHASPPVKCKSRHVEDVASVPEPSLVHAHASSPSVPHTSKRLAIQVVATITPELSESE
ncbi:hypothetical protein L208DRAFT_1374681 [Tricholoma matsutake]|nr:hypothetical protein L208DRAFT_1374681 [Tricholoma matsutake 945]